MFDVKKDALEYARENKELLKEAARRHKPTLSELANRNSYYAKPAFLQRFEGLTWNDILDEDEKKEFLAQEEPETKLAQNTVGNNMNTNNTMSDVNNINTTALNNMNTNSTMNNNTASGFSTTQSLMPQNPGSNGINQTPVPITSMQSCANYNSPIMKKVPRIYSIIQNDNYLNEEQRINALKNNKNIKLDIKNNPEVNYDWPKYTFDWLGKYYVDKNNDIIEKYATKNKIDPDLVRAVMYNEGATGHKFMLNYLGDLFRISGSQMPMNIQGKTWGDFGGRHYDTYDAEQNVALGTMLLRRLQDSLKNPTPDRIGTLWNATAADNINNVGARVKTAYETKPWLTSKKWQQKLLEKLW